MCVRHILFVKFVIMVENLVHTQVNIDFNRWVLITIVMWEQNAHIVSSIRTIHVIGQVTTTLVILLWDKIGF